MLEYGQAILTRSRMLCVDELGSRAGAARTPPVDASAACATPLRATLLRPKKTPRWYRAAKTRGATKGQKRTMRRLAPVYALTSPPYGVQLARLDAVWGSGGAAARYDVLDVGFGRGESVLAALQRRSDARVLAIDSFKPGIAMLYAGLERAGVAGDRARVWGGDAAKLIDRHWPALGGGAGGYAGFAEARFICPDPWETTHGRAKEAQRAEYAAQLRAAEAAAGCAGAAGAAARGDAPQPLPPPDRAFAPEGDEQRVLRPSTLRLLETRVLRRDGGLLRVVTDVPTLAAATRRMVAAAGDGRWRELGAREVAASWGGEGGPPATTYLDKARAEGRAVVDLAWVRVLARGVGGRYA